VRWSAARGRLYVTAAGLRTAHRPQAGLHGAGRKPLQTWAEPTTVPGVPWLSSAETKGGPPGPGVRDVPRTGLGTQGPGRLRPSSRPTRWDDCVRRRADRRLSGEPWTLGLHSPLRAMLRPPLA